MPIRFHHRIVCDLCPFGEETGFEDLNQDLNRTLAAAQKAGWALSPKGRWACPKCQEAAEN